MYVQTLDGFNPLKALGRALGGTGRALISAIPVVGGAAANVLQTAAKAPAKTTTIVDAAGNAANVNSAGQIVGAVAPNPSAPASAPAPSTSSDDFLKQMLMMQAMQNQQQQAAPSAPIYIPSGGGGTTPVFMPTQAPIASQLPQWALPAMIGGALLLFMQMQKK